MIYTPDWSGLYGLAGWDSFGNNLFVVRMLFN